MLARSVVYLCALLGLTATAVPLLKATFPEIARGQSTRIVSGWEAEEGQIPFQLSLRMLNTAGSVSACGGTIIHPEWGLTAAHCTALRTTVVIRAGAVNLTRPEIIFETTQYYNHPNYNDNQQSIVQPDDICLLRFGRALVYSDRVQQVRLQPSFDRNRNYEGERLIASGWGRTWTDSASPENMNWVYLSGVTNLDCWLAFGGSSIIQDSTICARGYNVSSQSTCQGDSGGPLTVVDADNRPTQIGTSSFVSSAGCHADIPAGFIRPGHYHDWYYSVTGINFDWEPIEVPTTVVPDSEEESSSSEEDSSSSSSSEEDSEEGQEVPSTVELPQTTTEGSEIPSTVGPPETEGPEVPSTVGPPETEGPEVPSTVGPAETTTTEGSEVPSTVGPPTTEEPEEESEEDESSSSSEEDSEEATEGPEVPSTVGPPETTTTEGPEVPSTVGPAETTTTEGPEVPSTVGPVDTTTTEGPEVPSTVGPAETTTTEGPEVPSTVGPVDTTTTEGPEVPSTVGPAETTTTEGPEVPSTVGPVDTTTTEGPEVPSTVGPAETTTTEGPEVPSTVGPVDTTTTEGPEVPSTVGPVESPTPVFELVNDRSSKMSEKGFFSFAQKFWYW